MFTPAGMTLFCMVAACSSSAGGLGRERAYVLAESLEYSRQGEFRGCGLSLTLLQEGARPSRDLLSVSMNFWLERPSHALVKTTLDTATNGGHLQVDSRPITRSWLSIGSDQPLAPTQTLLGEEQALFSLVALPDAIAFVTAVMHGTQDVQAGFTQRGAEYERVFYGAVRVERDSRELLQSCFRALLYRLGPSPKR